MKIAFVGKGGSGKSTLAHRMCQYLSGMHFFILAVDADHNMDLAYNLDANFTGPYLANSREDILVSEENNEQFRLNPADPFTEKYSRLVHPRIRLMASGPHTDEILQGKRCSHSLSSGLKKYFPNLSLGDKEIVIVDEKAGSDGVGTGVLKEFDRVFVVTEPTLYSLKSSHQIADILEYFKIPYSFVMNKVQNNSIEELNLRREPVWSFPFNSNMAKYTDRLGKEEMGGLEILLSACC